jgi:hypothetical protein
MRVDQPPDELKPKRRSGLRDRAGDDSGEGSCAAAARGKRAWKPSLEMLVPIKIIF